MGLFLRPLDAYSHRLQCAQRRQAVLASQEASDFGVTLGNPAEHQRTMRDRLVTRYGELARDTATWLHSVISHGS
jgi:hypothetical protein